MPPIPFALLVRVPEQHIRNHGVFSTKGDNSIHTSTRFLHEDQEKIKRAAEMVGTTFTTFIRESTIQMAKAILHHAEQHAKNEKEKGNVHPGSPDG